MNGGCRRTVVGWRNWRDSTHGSKKATHCRSARCCPHQNTRGTWLAGGATSHSRAWVDDADYLPVIHLMQPARDGEVRLQAGASGQYPSGVACQAGASDGFAGASNHDSATHRRRSSRQLILYRGSGSHQRSRDIATGSSRRPVAAGWLAPTQSRTATLQRRGPWSAGLTPVGLRGQRCPFTIEIDSNDSHCSMVQSDPPILVLL
jgi:hypothetical protein